MKIVDNFSKLLFLALLSVSKALSQQEESIKKFAVLKVRLNKTF
jgi:hypothetical protein